MKLKNVIRIKKLQKMLVLQNDLGITKDTVYPDGAVESMLDDYRELVRFRIKELREQDEPEYTGRDTVKWHNEVSLV